MIVTPKGNNHYPDAYPSAFHRSSPGQDHATKISSCPGANRIPRPEWEGVEIYLAYAGDQGVEQESSQNDVRLFLFGPRSALVGRRIFDPARA
jgi:hypothetical protein